MSLLEQFWYWFLYGDTGYGHITTWIIYIICAIPILYHILYRNKKMFWASKLMWMIGIGVWVFGIYEWGFLFCYFAFTKGWNLAYSFVYSMPFFIVFVPVTFIPKLREKLVLNFNPRWFVLFLFVGFLIVRVTWILAPFPHNYPSNYFPQVFLDLEGNLALIHNDIIRILNFFDKLFLSYLVTHILLMKKMGRKC